LQGACWHSQFRQAAGWIGQYVFCTAALAHQFIAALIPGYNAELLTEPDANFAEIIDRLRVSVLAAWDMSDFDDALQAREFVLALAPENVCWRSLQAQILEDESGERDKPLPPPGFF